MSSPRNQARRRAVEILLGVFAGCALLAVVQFAQASETSATVILSYAVEHVQTAPIVDGVLDDPAWQELEPQRFDWEVDSALTWAQSAEFDGSFRAVWRDGTVYIALRLDDDELMSIPSAPTESDRVELYIESRPALGVQLLTVPVFEVSSLEDDDSPFVAWSADGSVCEMSLESESMYADRRELGINLIFVDVDPEQPSRRIGWVPQGPNALKPQLGTFRFADNLSVDAKLVTSWGNLKTLY
jgi:hypothetical protein